MNSNYFLRLCILYIAYLPFAFIVLPAAAQLAPSEVRPPSEPLPDLETLPSPEELIPPLTAPEESIPRPQLDIPGTIEVKQFEVVGSTVFSQSELATLLEPYTNRPISFAELLQAQESITQLYLDRGYITTGSFIPPQTLKNGVVRIEVVEGSVEAIEVTGLKRLRASYVRNRLERSTRAPLNQDELLNALQVLQLNPLIDRLSAELSLGTSAGRNILTIEVDEARALTASLSLDNQRVPSVGTDRRIVEVTHANLFGLGDRFNARYNNTDGSNALDELSYTVPVNPANGTIGLTYRLIESNVIEDLFDELDLESDFQQYTLTYRQPIIQAPNQDLAIGLTLDRQESDVNLLDGLIEGQTRIFALRLFQEYTKRTRQDVFAARSQLSAGLEGEQTALSGDEVDEEFYVWRGQLQYVRVLSRNNSLLFRSDLQLADRPLIPIEQFSLGGGQSVRGYQQDLLLSDNGFFISAEARTTIARFLEGQGTLQLAPFFDLGTAWNRDDEPVTPRETIYSVGLGLSLGVGERLSARLDWGIPLVDVNVDGDTLQENGIYFSIKFKL